jgi:L-alanine-DL-glutamate epimerase-like enolase superfamily enzyme
LSSSSIVHFDFDTALMFKEDPVTGGICYEKNGVITVPDAPGLGATIANEWLDKMEQVHF